MRVNGPTESLNSESVDLKLLVRGLDATYSTLGVTPSGNIGGCSHLPSSHSFAAIGDFTASLYIVYSVNLSVPYFCIMVFITSDMIHAASFTLYFSWPGSWQ